MSLPSNLLEVTPVDIQRLIADRVQEGPRLDFKRDLPKTWDSSAKHELLADVTAFATSGSGDIVYGVDENYAAEASAVSKAAFLQPLCITTFHPCERLYGFNV